MITVFRYITNCRSTLWPISAVVLAGLLVSACVSSTLEPSNPEHTGLTSELALSEDERANLQLRNEGIAEIRAKARAAPVNEAAPAYGLPRESATTLLSPQEIVEKTDQMNANSAQVQTQLPDEELLERKRKMEELRRKGVTHYQSTLKQIEKK